MAIKLTDAEVKRLAGPASGNRVTYDTEVAGFGCRVTAAGAKSFVLNYRASGRERRLTIGSFPDWSVKDAREQAKAQKRRVDDGADPMADRHAGRAAITVASLAVDYRNIRLSRKRPRSAAEDERLLRLYILPALGNHKVANVRRRDLVDLHRKISRTAPISANRVISLTHAIFAFAIREEILTENPARDIERNPEDKRSRYLTPAEISRLTAALNAHKNQVSANVIRLLLLTGARRGEVLSATWDQFDLSTGIWTKPAATTKQKREHRLPLSAPTLAVLTKMKAAAADDAMQLFPGRKDNDAQGDIKRFWAAVCKAAAITDARVHDLRHTHAAILASGGASLPLIGALLGHTQPATTARYAHLMDDPLRVATERAGAAITGEATANVVPLRRPA